MFSGTAASQSKRLSHFLLYKYLDSNQPVYDEALGVKPREPWKICDYERPVFHHHISPLHPFLTELNKIHADLKLKNNTTQIDPYLISSQFKLIFIDTVPVTTKIAFHCWMDLDPDP